MIESLSKIPLEKQKEAIKLIEIMDISDQLCLLDLICSYLHKLNWDGYIEDHPQIGFIADHIIKKVNYIIKQREQGKQYIYCQECYNYYFTKVEEHPNNTKNICQKCMGMVYNPINDTWSWL